MFFWPDFYPKHLNKISTLPVDVEEEERDDVTLDSVARHLERLPRLPGIRFFFLIKLARLGSHI